LSIARACGLSNTNALFTVNRAGIIGFTKALELTPFNITVDVIAPDPIGSQTLEVIIEAMPLGRLGKPSDIANTIVFLASEEASFITGIVIVIDGGSLRSFHSFIASTHMNPASSSFCSLGYSI